MSQLLNQPQSGVGNGGELLACITDLGPVGQRPVPLLCEHLVAVLCKCFFRHKMHAKVGWDGWGLWLIEKGIFIPLPLRSLSPTCPLPQPSSLSSSWLVWKERRTYKGGTHWRHLSIWAALYLGGALADSRKDARWLDRPRTCKSTLD